MEFKLTTTGDYYSRDDSAALESLGFQFQYTTEGHFKEKYLIVIDTVLLTISSLEELLDLANKWGEIIISKDIDPGRYKIEIYDDYRE